jgi:hypothetical protein
MEFHKLLIPDDNDDEKQMSNILMHIHLGVVDHFIIHVYMESSTRDGYDRRSITLYHHIDIGCFPELNDVVRNSPSKVHVTCKLHCDVDDSNE